MSPTGSCPFLKDLKCRKIHDMSRLLDAVRIFSSKGPNHLPPRGRRRRHYRWVAYDVIGVAKNLKIAWGVAKCIKMLQTSVLWVLRMSLMTSKWIHDSPAFQALRRAVLLVLAAPAPAPFNSHWSIIGHYPSLPVTTLAFTQAIAEREEPGQIWWNSHKQHLRRMEIGDG